MDKKSVVDAIKELIGYGEVYTISVDGTDRHTDVIDAEIDHDGDIRLITKERLT